MRVLISVIVSFLFLNAAILYSPIKLKNFNFIKVKKLKNLNIDFNNSLAILNYNHLPFILNKNLIIVTGFGVVKDSILTNQKKLCEINTIANLDFESKILLSQTNSHYKEVNATFRDFLEKKIDAYVLNRDFDKPSIYDFKLSDYGLKFDKYFLVTSRNFLKKHHKLVEEINRYFEYHFDFDEDRVYETLFITSLFLNKKIDFNKVLFENYNVEKEKKEIPLIVDTTPNWPPFNIYKNGHLYGIGVDFWKTIAKKAKLKYHFKIVNYWPNVLKDIKEKKADLTINTSETPERKKYALFSKPYISFPLAIICRNDESFNSINDINSLAVGKNFSAEKLMKEHYPNLNYIETKTTFDALNLVKNKKADCAVDILPTILWIINQNHLMNLQIAFKTSFKFNVQIMIRNDKGYLVDEINKAIDEITPQERQAIVNRYLKTIVIEKSHKINKWLIFGLIFIVLLGIGIYLKSKEKVEKIEKEALNDELTSILNRRGVLEEIKNVKKGSILFFDIDYFKKFNDTYGHDFGDYVLKEMGKILKETFRKSDIVGRWGGEEFIVVLPDTEYDVGLKLAEKLRKRVQNYDFKNKKVTISIGVSEFRGDFEKALKKADIALYKAKNSGRNQVKGNK